MTAVYTFEQIESDNGQSLICDLTYSCYAHNRDNGLSAEGGLRLFPETGAEMEQRYQSEVS
jgi:hypothetical protein